MVSIVLGGGAGTRLLPLTKLRSKPAVPLAGKYRLIDIPISNCINSDIRRIYLLTQFNSVSLHRHIRQTYRFDPFSGGFVEILAAQQTNEGTEWYQGTADAVRKQLRYLQQPGIDYVLILSGDQLYRMNYKAMLQTHIESKADVTIGALPVTPEDAAGFGIMRLNDSGRVESFIEKPKTEKELAEFRTDPDWIEARNIPSNGRAHLASMGIYLFDRDTLVDVLTKTEYSDFGRDIFPASIRARHVQVHLFDDYWEDIGTIRAFYDANLALTDVNPPFSLDDEKAPIYTRARFLPPSRVDGAEISRSLITEGCRIAPGCRIEHCLVGLRCCIGEKATIKDSILMGADFYKRGEDEKGSENRPPVGIGAGSVIERAIVDKNCRIGKNVTLVVPAGTADGEYGPITVRDTIAVVPKDTVLPDGWKFGND